MRIYVKGDPPYDGNVFDAEPTDDPNVMTIPGWRWGTRTVKRTDRVMLMHGVRLEVWELARR